VDEHGQLRLEEPCDHPLWRVTLATGLASGQVGVVVVLHHALADGIAGAALAQRLLDPATDTVAASKPWQPTSPPGPLALTIDAVATRLATVAAGPPDWVRHAMAADVERAALIRWARTLIPFRTLRIIGKSPNSSRTRVRIADPGLSQA
jgi:Wax ester synthase/diacylglycerol acyltransferase catalytic domain